MNIEISVVLPCYPPHIKYLGSIFNNLASQTVGPKEVILAISGINPNVKNYLYQRLKAILRKIPLHIVHSTKNQAAGTNRNMGSKLATGSHIMFIDADDLIHPKKIEATVYFLLKYAPNVLVHSYVLNKPRNFLDKLPLNYLNARVIFNDRILSDTFQDLRKRDPKRIVPIKIRGYDHIARGYPTVTKEVMQKYQFSDRPRGQDSEFLQEILCGDGKIIYVDLPLLNYR